MPKIKITSVKIETVIMDTDKIDKHDQYLIDEMGAEQYVEVTVSENEFSMDLDENPALISWDTKFFGDTTIID